MRGGEQGESLLAACGGDTVKIFDVSVEIGDPCCFQYTPSPSSQVNCAKWNHTNLVVASAGEDRKISLWMKNGQSVGVLPTPGNDVGETVDETILSLCFSSKGSRYLCSGGTGRIVRVWDLQRKRCIKWLKGHTETITGVLYNCKDEHLASISLHGDLIVHNLASGARATELKDPHNQVLRVLDYSPTSRHILVTAGDDGSLHLWDTTGRMPKVSWLKQHSAPISGVSFSPASDKMIISVGFDKKLYSFDPGMKKPVFAIPCEAPFSSLAFKDDGHTIAAGTNTGRVIFYDARGKPQPFTILRAYGSSEAVNSLCWQRSKPILVNEANCSPDAALLGSIGEESVLMPDPLPPSTNSSHVSSTTVVSSGRNSRSIFSTLDSTPMPTKTSSGDEGIGANHLRTSGAIPPLQTRNFSFKDDMEVFSPLVDVQPITPSVSNIWDNRDELKKESNLADVSKKAVWSIPARKFPTLEEPGVESYSSFMTPTKQDGSPSKSSFSQFVDAKSDEYSSATPPEAWGGDKPMDRFGFRQQTIQNASRLSSSGATDSSGLLTGTVSATKDILSAASSSGADYLAKLNITASMPAGSDILNTGTTTSGATSSAIGSKTVTVHSISEIPTSVPVGLPRRYMQSIDRKTNLNLSKGGSSGDIPAPTAASPKQKKTGTERREDSSLSETFGEGKRNLEQSTFLKPEFSSAVMASALLSNGNVQSNSPRNLVDHNQGPPSFALQLVQRTLEECLGSVQSAIHEDVQNLHLELLRQFHIQQIEMTSMMNSLLERQSELIKEVRALREENQQLRRLL